LPKWTHAWIIAAKSATLDAQRRGEKVWRRNVNLLMVSGDSSVAQGRDGAFYQMLRHFARHWSRIDILCPRAPGAQPRRVFDNVYVHPSPWHKALQPWFVYRRGRALLAERDYALAVSHDYGFFVQSLGVWALGLPVVSEIFHIEGYPRAATRRERLQRAAAFVYVRWARNRAAAFRAMNRVEMPELLRRLGVADDKILVLSALYLDYARFRPLPDEPRRCDVLFVGRLAANKGLFTLLDALARVKAAHPAVRLGVRGDGPLRPALERRIAALKLSPNVDWIPRLDGPDDLARLYNQAGMLVCASTAEGGPRVTVEAMACGVPVISTPVGVMPELVRDGENGLLFNWEAGELAVKIRQLLDDETGRRLMGEAGRASVQGFEAEAVIEAYARGYHALIERLREASCAC
jgi:glycosyltransferase involved in cell wall biosynthesis